jgi:hypothetical protein
MDQGIAIVIAAGISGGISVIIGIAGMLANNFFNLRSNERQREWDFKERSFNEIYQRKIALFEDVIKTLAVMGRTEDDLMKMSKQEFSDKVFADSHALFVLSSRLIICGSPRARDIIIEAISEINVIFKELSEGFSDGVIILSSEHNILPLEFVIGRFFLIVNGALKKFAACVTEEIGTNSVTDGSNKIQKE